MVRATSSRDSVSESPSTARCLSRYWRLGPTREEFADSHTSEFGVESSSSLEERCLLNMCSKHRQVFWKYFLTADECEDICEKLNLNPIEGLCDCLSVALMIIGKGHRCYKKPIITSEFRMKSRWQVRQLQDDGLMPCRCRVSYSELILFSVLDITLSV